MLCRDPFVKNGIAHPCGRCLPCLVNRRRTWTHRIMLESLMHSQNSFITLTYSDEYLPKGGSLAPEEIRDWLKRVRSAIAPRKIRYYAVGEYGETTSRPHYHVAMFGYGPCQYGRSRYNSERQECCSVCDTVRDTWGRGQVLIGDLTIQSGQYIAGYVTKKMTRFDDPRLNGRHPEFARMSLKPGIGADAMHDLASVLLQFDLAETQGDVPSSLRVGSRIMPLGRYLRRHLRTLVGMEPNAPNIKTEYTEEMRALYDAWFNAPKAPGERKEKFKEFISKIDDQKVVNLEARRAIFEKGKSL